MSSSPVTRPSLILRLQNHSDLQAWQEFTELYQPLVYRLARRRGFQHSDACDIMQEVLIRVAGAIDRWNPDQNRGSFRGWLNRIARNLMISFLEKQDRRPEIAGYGSVADLLAVSIDAPHLKSDEFDEELQRQLFHRAAERIQRTCQPATWQAFWHTAVLDRPAAEVAEQLDMSVGAVYVARSRVIRRLKEDIQQFHQTQQEAGG